MIPTVPLFILIAVGLIGLLFWAIRPPARKPMPIDKALQVLSAERQFSYLPQIMQALDPEDEAYLRAGRHNEILHRMRIERKRAVLRFLDCLHADFEALLEASRAMAVVAPQLIAMQEFERLKLSMRFAMNCAYLRWKLRLGLTPWIRLGVLSEMAANIARSLEIATAQAAEGSVPAPEFPSAPERGDGGLE